MLVALPETSSANILLRRAQRLRRLTGNARFMSQSEIEQRNMKLSSIFVDALIKPLEITLKDPAVLFVQIYTAIIYGIYYFCAYPRPPPVLASSRWLTCSSPSRQSSRSSPSSIPSTTT